MAIQVAAAYTYCMVTFDDKTETVINEAVERAGRRTDQKIAELEARLDQTINATIERSINEAIERSVGFYYEKTKDDIALVLEATDFIIDRIDDMPTRQEFNELADNVELNHLAIKETNRDLDVLRARVDKLEHA